MAQARQRVPIPTPTRVEAYLEPNPHARGANTSAPAAMAFSSVPVLDLSLALNSNTKGPFLDSLRHALLEVGFFYIKNVGISDGLIEDVITQGKAFFDLPEEKKLEVQMKNVPSFLGIVVICLVRLSS